MKWLFLWLTLAVLTGLASLPFMVWEWWDKNKPTGEPTHGLGTTSGEDASRKA